MILLAVAFPPRGPGQKLELQCGDRGAETFEGINKYKITMSPQAALKKNKRSSRGNSVSSSQ